MAENLLETMKLVDPAVLSEVVRMDQKSPTFEITNWAVERLSDKGVINPDGLWLFRGAGSGLRGSRAWSIVVKVFQPSKEERPPSDLWYWKRELSFAQSRLGERMPGPVRAPRFYRIDETSSGIWLWMEHVRAESDAAWVLEDYAFAAHQLGMWNGRLVTAARLPDEPWFAQQPYRSWLAVVDPEKDWQFPLHAKYIQADIRKRYDQIYAEREMFFNTLENLPETFSHFDSQRRNLFIRKSMGGQKELVIVDWANCGLGPLGAELYALVAMSCLLFEVPVSDLTQLDEVSFRSYLQGLHEAGWSGDQDIIRLGYSAWVAVWHGVIFPFALSAWCSPESREFSIQQFGLAEDELYLQWLPVFSYALDCADEARLLMKKLGMA